MHSNAELLILGLRYRRSREAKCGFYPEQAILEVQSARPSNNIPNHNKPDSIGGYTTATWI